MRMEASGKLVAEKEDWEKALQESNARLIRFLQEPINSANDKVLRAEMYANGIIRDKVLRCM